MLAEWSVEKVDNTYRICYNGACKATSQDMGYAYDLVRGLNCDGFIDDANDLREMENAD